MLVLAHLLFSQCHLQEDDITSTSELLQMATERIGILYSTTLNTSSNESMPVSLVRNNIGKLTSVLIRFICMYHVLTHLLN